MDITFRKSYDGEIIAVFARPWSRRGYDLAAYASIGQHTPIDLEFYRDCTAPASPSEYAGLLDELRAVGYDDLRIVRRLPVSDIFRYRN